MPLKDNLKFDLKGITNVPGLKQFIKSSDKVGLPPGSLVHVGEKKTDKTIIRLLDYSADQFDEIEVESVEQCLKYKERSTVTWIQVFGLHDTSVIAELGSAFEIHPLVLEDILNTNQRPKFEEYESHLYLTLKNLSYAKEGGKVQTEQVSIVTGPGYVLSFQEEENGLFNPIRSRIQNKKLRIRKKDADYLTYALIDNVVDHYFVVLENLADQLEELDGSVMEKLSREHLETLFHLKKCFMEIRKSVIPLQEVILQVLNEEYELIQESTLLYFRDIRDHVHHIVDTLDTYREEAKNAVDTHLSLQSMKMNEVMKVLTIAATIFMPLTFIAGIYGMNFKFMPELEWKWGYFSVLGGMIIVMIIMFIYFRHRKWL